MTGHTLHRPTTGGHLLVTVDVGEFWGKMPAQAVRARITDRLARYATALTAAGYGVATWGRGDQPEALIVAMDQAGVDRQAPDVRAYLTAHNVRKDRP